MAVRPAHAGDPLNKGISASDWNALNEMRRRKSNASIIGTTATDDALDGIVTVKNTTGNNLPPGSIVGLDAPFILPDGTSDDARLMLNFQGVVPTDGTGSTTDYTGRFGILLDGVSGEYGAPTVPARIFDGAYCKLYMQSATDQFADIEHNNTTRLKSGSSGSAQILYHYPMGSTYPQETYGYVRLGNKSPGGISWSGGINSILSVGSSNTLIPWAERTPASFATVSAGVITISRTSTYSFHLTLDLSIGLSNTASADYSSFFWGWLTENTNKIRTTVVSIQQYHNYSGSGSGVGEFNSVSAITLSRSSLPVALQAGDKIRGYAIKQCSETLTCNLNTDIDLDFFGEPTGTPTYSGCSLTIREEATEGCLPTEAA